MQTPEAILSPSEQRLLRDLASGGDPSFAFDWVALQRLKAFGYVEEAPTGALKVTAEGRRAAARSGRSSNSGEPRP